ncbi:MAG: ATP-binding protein [Phycisphaerales bacterium]
MNIKVSEIETALRQRQETLLAVLELKEAIRLTDADIRKHIFALRKVTQKDIDLVAAIKAYVGNYEKQNKLKVTLNIEGDINSKLSNRVKTRLLRIFQELLVNIRKHAAANQADIILFEDGRQFSMIIRDDGKGFHPENLKTKTVSFGFESLEDDIRDMGAKLDLQSCPGKGTTVTVQLDLKEEGIF